MIRLKKNKYNISKQLAFFNSKKSSNVFFNRFLVHKLVCRFLKKGKKSKIDKYFLQSFHLLSKILNVNIYMIINIIFCKLKVVSELVSYRRGRRFFKKVVLVNFYRQRSLVIQWIYLEVQRIRKLYNVNISNAINFVFLEIFFKESNLYKLKKQFLIDIIETRTLTHYRW